ncbi:hypothetical protein PCC7424_5356 (plasmid) [Gloeothece citriformis PCC 7424]|uniref:Uncharacterized protein n=1 Tax=Gloeothece citriformis (strain PCC 7424) TaxID=65393 RepID=B7KMB7_GLOC7|nr:hypothetical protein [Gloeothece citriformis]ACK73939.1 hypothetical protein PCC7424_5356 [Gloeothece citriformis PCC 7424]
MIQRKIIVFFLLYILPFILAQSTALAYESVSLEILSLSCQTEVLNVFSDIRQYQTMSAQIENNPLPSLSEIAIAGTVRERSFESFDEKFDFLIRNREASAYY